MDDVDGLKTPLLVEERGEDADFDDYCIELDEEERVLFSGAVSWFDGLAMAADGKRINSRISQR